MKIPFNNISNYNAIVFDFDYTLADSSKDVCECVSYALKEMGYDCPGYDSICKTIGKPLSEMFSIFTGNDNYNDGDIFTNLFHEKENKLTTDGTFIFEEVETLFEYLKIKGIKLGIVSSKRHYKIEEVLERDSLIDYVDIIIGADDVTNLKPDPEGLIKVIEYLGLSKEQCLFVGDSIVDALTARNLGIDFMAVLTGMTKRKELEEYKPLSIINRLDKLIHKI